MKLVLGTVLALALSNVSFANEHAAAGHCKGDKKAEAAKDEKACKKAKGKWEAAAAADAGHEAAPEAAPADHK